jgi:hypothetical protein
MGFTNQQERELLAHIQSASNPHRTTFTQTGINTTDDLIEGHTNKFSTPYTIDPEIKNNLEERYGIDINLYRASTTEVFNLIFDLLNRG